MTKLTKLNSSVIVIDDLSIGIKSITGSGAGGQIDDLLTISSNLPDSTDVTIIADRISDYQTRTSDLDGNISGSSYDIDSAYVLANIDDDSIDGFKSFLSSKEDKYLTFVASGVVGSDAVIAAISAKRSLMSPETKSGLEVIGAITFPGEEILNYTCYDGDVYVISKDAGNTNHHLRRLELVDNSFNIKWTSSFTNAVNTGAGHGEMSVSDNFVVLVFRKSSVSEMITFNPDDGSEYARQDTTKKVLLLLTRNDEDGVFAVCKDSQADPDYFVHYYTLTPSSIIDSDSESFNSGVLTVKESQYTPLFCQFFYEHDVVKSFVVGGSTNTDMNTVFYFDVNTNSTTARGSLYPGISNTQFQDPDFVITANTTVGIKINRSPYLFASNAYEGGLTAQSNTLHTMSCIGKSAFNDINGAGFNNQFFSSYLMIFEIGGGTNYHQSTIVNNGVIQVEAPNDSVNSSSIEPIVYKPTGPYGLYVCRDGNNYGFYVLEEASRESVTWDPPTNSRMTDVDGTFVLDEVIASGSGLGLGGIIFDDGINGNGKALSGEIKLEPLFINTNETYYKVR